MNKFIAIMICLIGIQIYARGRDLSDPPLRIEGTKVSTEVDAKDLGFKAYMQKMRLEVTATEGVRNIDIITLGYDVSNFAKKGERIWEVRVRNLEGELRAIMWINPGTEKVYFGCGAWEEFLTKGDGR
jgi:hypothetical protein